MAEEKAELKIERRFLAFKISELRADGGDKPTLTGYAAKFNSEGVDEFWGFREIIAPGAFAETINKDDIRGLFNHDPNHVLGRNTSGTLRLSEDGTGLRMEVDINPEDADAMSVFAKIKRGDVTGQSFSFVVDGKDGAEWDESEMKDGKMPLRTLKRLKLYDVGPVTYPFYESTDVTAAMRSLEIYRENRGTDQGVTVPDGSMTQGRRLAIAKYRVRLHELEMEIER